MRSMSEADRNKYDFFSFSPSWIKDTCVWYKSRKQEFAKLLILCLGKISGLLFTVSDIQSNKFICKSFHFHVFSWTILKKFFMTIYLSVFVLSIHYFSFVIIIFIIHILQTIFLLFFFYLFTLLNLFKRYFHLQTF